MSLILEINFSRDECLVIVTVADPDNRGLTGKVTLVTDNSGIQEHEVNPVTVEPIKIPFAAPKDGKLHQFEAIFVLGDNLDQDKLIQYFKVCN